MKHMGLHITRFAMASLLTYVLVGCGTAPSTAPPTDQKPDVIDHKPEDKGKKQSQSKLGTKKAAMCVNPTSCALQSCCPNYNCNLNYSTWQWKCELSQQSCIENNNSCLYSGQCCSGNCSNGSCAPDPNCAPQFTICYSGQDCCSGQCVPNPFGNGKICTVP